VLVDCLINTIGLASGDTTCWSSSSETDWTTVNASKSGYILTENEYVPELDSVKNLGTILIASRKDAVQDLLMKLRVSLGRLSKLNINNYSDTIGKPEKSGFAIRGLDYNLSGFVFGPYTHYKGVQALIRAGSLKLDTDGTYAVTVTRLHPEEEEIDTFSIQTTAGRIAYSAALDIDLPLDHRGQKTYYAVHWERVGTEKPFNVETVCGCDDDPIWHKSKLLTVSGFNTDNLSTIDTDKLSTNKNTYGLHLDIELECDALAWMCGVSDSFWTTNHIGTTFAKCVQLLATKKLINKLLDQSGINEYNLLSQETMRTSTHKINSMLKGLVDWMALRIAESPVVATRTDCIQCKPALGMGVHHIDEL